MLLIKIAFLAAMYFVCSAPVQSANINDDLILESSRGRLEIVEQLVGKGADVNYINPSDLTPLMVTNNEIIADFLIKSGAKVDGQSRKGCTALMKTRSSKVLNLLLKNNAQIELVDENGHTALLHAITNHSTHIVKVLLDNGADSDAIDKNGDTVFQYACKNGTRAIVFMLFNQTRLESINKNTGLSALFYAILSDNFWVLKALMCWYKENVFIKYLDRESLLQFAYKHSARECIDFLINYDSNVLDHLAELIIINNGSGVRDARVSIEEFGLELAGKNGMTPLHYAVICNDIPTIRKLLESGVQIDPVNADGHTPLSLALKGVSPHSCICYLLEQQASLEKASKHCKLELIQYDILVLTKREGAPSLSYRDVMRDKYRMEEAGVLKKYFERRLKVIDSAESLLGLFIPLFYMFSETLDNFEIYKNDNLVAQWISLLKHLNHFLDNEANIKDFKISAPVSRFFGHFFKDIEVPNHIISFIPPAIDMLCFNSPSSTESLYNSFYSHPNQDLIENLMKHKFVEFVVNLVTSSLPDV